MTIPKFFFIAVVVVMSVAIGVLYFLHFGTKTKFVYVDAQKLVNGYAVMKEAKKNFEVKTAGWQANLDSLRTIAENKIKEYQATSAKLTPRERKLMEELIQSKQDQFTTYQQAIADKVKQEDDELSTKILMRINDFMKRYGKQKGYSIIFAATKYGNIAYAEDSTDVTQEVLAGLNAEYHAK